MRPHSFKCGKVSTRDGVKRHIGASMRPHSFKCGKMWWPGLRYMYIMSFNEAALFQVRKAPHANCAMAPAAGFNEAALFQVRKVRCEPGIVDFCRSFNEAALFQVRKVSAHRHVKAPRM